MRTRHALATLALTAAVSATARADVVFADFQSGTATGWGWLTGDQRGILPWDISLGPAAGTVVEAPSGPLAGSNVLRMTGDAAFNYGQASGAVLAFDIAPNFRQAFLDHDQIEFDWYAPPDANSTAGWSQVYNDILNSEAAGFQTVGGYSLGDENQNQFYFEGFGGSLQHVVIDYTAYKNAVLASAFPDGGGWLQFGFQLNAGGGAPAEMWFDNFKFSLAAEIWNVDADGVWSTDTNWSRGAHPNAAGKVATFGPIITEPRLVTVDAPATVGQINFNNASAYTIAGANTLTLDSASATGITVSSGSHAISAPLALAKDVNVNVAAADSTLTISNLQPSTVAVTKTGAGVLAVNNMRSNSLDVQGGTLRVLPDSTAAGVSKVAALTIADGAKLDLTDNKLITASPAGTWNGVDAYTGVAGLVDAGRGNAGNALWDGATGITTTDTRAINNGDLVSIGVAAVSEVRTVADTETTTFAGQTVNGSDTLAMVTWGGDATLDGKINIDDYGRIDGNVGQSGSVFGWSRGDFNYDGKINIDDYGIIDGNINRQVTPF